MNPRKRITTISAALILFVVLLVVLLVVPAGGVLGSEPPSAAPVRLLVIDETHNIQSSLQIGQFALALKRTGLFDIDAMTEVPLDGHSNGPAYDLVLIIPEKPSQLWIVTADLPARLSPAVQAAFQALKDIASRVYEGENALDARIVADVTEDLFPAIYGGLLAQNGWFRLASDTPDSSLNRGGS